MRTWDWVAAQRPDKLIPISKTVAKRSKKYYDRQPSQVIFPPVKTNPSPPVSPKKSFYLVVSRLVPYKRIDLAIKACNQIRANLVVIGTGSQEKTLKKLAGPTITFKGFVPEKKLTKYYQQAQALIFAAEEDFGITSVEAQSYGTPVIGFAKGGVAETVIDGETGVLFAKQTPKSIISAIKKYENLTFSPNRAITNAQKFSENKFRTQFKKFVEAAWQKHKTKWKQ